MGYLFVDTKDVDNKVRSVHKTMNDAIDTGAAVIANSSLLYNAMYNGTGYKSSLSKKVSAADALCERAKNLMTILDDAGVKYQECEDDLKKKFDNFDKYTVGLENQIREYLGIDKIKTVDGQRAANVAKVVVGVCVIAVGAVVVAHFSAVSVTAFVIKSAVGASISAGVSGAEEMLNGGSFFDGAADGFMKGAISSSISNGLGTVLKTPSFDSLSKMQKFGVELGGSAFSSLTSSGISLIDGKRVTFGDVVKDVGVSVLSTGVEAGSEKLSKGFIKSVDDMNVKNGMPSIGKKEKQFIKFTFKYVPSATIDAATSDSEAKPAGTLASTLFGVYVPLD